MPGRLTPVSKAEGRVIRYRTERSNLEAMNAWRELRRGLHSAPGSLVLKRALVLLPRVPVVPRVGWLHPNRKGMSQIDLILSLGLGSNLSLIYDFAWSRQRQHCSLNHPIPVLYDM